jgi:phage baseplate assembly protein W
MDNLGCDLVVLPYLVAEDASTVDMATRARPVRANTLPILVSAFPRVTAFQTNPRELFDLAVFDGRNNLAQALLLRLVTPRGSLAQLGHAAYGSRLSELIGQPKTSATRALCRAYVLEVVAQEPRVEDTAVALSFDPERETASSFQFTLVVQPRQGGAPLSLALEVGL